ncbi:hypothetical protein [Vibrio lentus]|uniref:hypothetical protein n=1 Tax=Vibrio lentus TaxID=136468 RepID=UPI001E473642|nr:hypothetical protein [Vibrio lentus]MCC5526821.1 hypothetical protein [Vibrio lentus]
MSVEGSFDGLAQLAAGEVTFKHDGSETTSASFDVNVEDGNEDGSTPVDSTFNLTVTPVNDAPELTGDLSAEVDEAGSYTIRRLDAQQPSGSTNGRILRLQKTACSHGRRPNGVSNRPHL